MRGEGAAHQFGVVLVAAVILAGCSQGALSSSASTTPTASTTSTASTVAPESTQAIVVCPAPADAAGASPPEPGEWPGLNSPPGLSTAIEAETAALVAAIGNPDTGSPSAAWDAFEGSLNGGDAGAIRASAEIVIGHLRDACAAVNSYFDLPAAGGWATDVRGLFNGVAGAVAAMRDAAIGHDEAGLEAGRVRMQTALLDHFYQSFKMSDPEAYRVQLPDRRSSATASHIRWINPVGGAFDGDARTVWLAGNVASPQWVEVDFGAEATVTGIRLLTYQETAGATDHRVTVRTGAGTETELVRFTGDTGDGQWLEYTAPTPVQDIRYVRVTTVATPSMIGWREVEVTLAAGWVAGPCPTSTTAVTSVARTRADPSTGASDPALAVDGNEVTGWDPGPVRGLDGARGWIRVWYASQIRISEVRVLLGPGSAAAKYQVVLFPPGELGNGLGMLEPVPAGGGWVSLAGPNPCLPYESVYIWVKSEEPAGVIREIRVVGTAAP
jgi:hypothetical protein